MFKNTFLHGLIWGLITPIVGGGLFYLFDLWLIENEMFGQVPTWDGFKNPTRLLIAVCFNLIPSFIANRRRMDEFVRGIMFPTVIGAFAWLFYIDPLNLFGGS